MKKTLKASSNPQIGEVDCMAKNCTRSVPVFKFRDYGTARKLYAGKLYARCPVHGQFGWSGSSASAGAQQYITENAKLWNQSESEAGPESTDPQKINGTPRPAPPSAETPPAKPHVSMSSSSTPAPASSQQTPQCSGISARTLTTPRPRPRPAARTWAGYMNRLPWEPEAEET